MLSNIIVDSVAYGYLTKTAGTIIQQLIRPFKGARTKITWLKYTCGTTVHIGLIKMPIGTTALSAAAAAGQAVITLAAQPTAARNIAVADYIVVERKETASGRGLATWELYLLHASTAPVVNSDGTITVTLAANVAGAHLIGQKVWLMSLSTDVVPGYNQVCTVYSLTVSATTELPSNALAAAGGIASSWGDYEPLVFESNNATAAGFLLGIAAVGFVNAAGRASR